MSPYMSMLNSSAPSAAYVRQRIGLALVQIMACRLFGAEPLSKSVLVIVDSTPNNKLIWNFWQNTKLFIHENTSESCEIATILSRPQCVKKLVPIIFK